VQQRRLGRSGLYVSEVGIGCNNFGGRIDADATRAVVDAALDAGINFFDTADVYGGQRSEVLLGEALGSRRHDVVIATKFAMPMGPTLQDKGGSRRYLDGFAREQGHGLLDLAFGWLLSQPMISSVIAGATTPAQVADNVAAASAWRLDAAQFDAVADILADA